jgi:hypothetical protein
MTKNTAGNSRFAKVGVSCFYDSEVVIESSVLGINICDENPHLRIAANKL